MKLWLQLKIQYAEGIASYYCVRVPGDEITSFFHFIIAILCSWALGDTDFPFYKPFYVPEVTSE